MDTQGSSDPAADTLFLDLEVAGDGALVEIGAVLRDAEFHRRIGGGTTFRSALADLDRFAAAAQCVAGHNLIGFDLPYLRHPDVPCAVLGLAAVDTLVLSPLAFPAKPYHALVKDYKLLHDARNDPVADARLTRDLLADERRAFEEMARTDAELIGLMRSALEGWRPPATGRPSAAGTASWLASLGAPRFTDDEVLTRAAARFGRSACIAALRPAIRDTLADVANRPAVAFALAWLNVAETRSVLPRWVRFRFPAVAEIVRRVRDVPCGSDSCAWCSSAHDPRRQLAEHFRYDAFRGDPVGPAGRPAQEEVVRLGMQGRPHLAILPTSFGKSICYQLPALVRHARTGALTIVISPLQALMKDQVDGLVARTGAGLAVAVSGLLTPPERAEALAKVRDGDAAMLYVSPEQLRNRSFRETVRSREIAAWVFDEAHCLAKWGHDFRTDYHYAGRFLREFGEAEGAPVAPVACFTATARREVKEEILAYFREHVGQDLAVVEVPPGRPNLTFLVRESLEDSKFAALDDELHERLGTADDPKPGKAIIYLATRRRTEQAAVDFIERGWPARAFHAGMEPPEKREVQEAFKRGDVRVVCATNAFGMGIDEPDVRLVVHGDVPGSLENYLQEAGRAGRDGRPAHCVLLFHERDLDRQFDLLAKSRLTRLDLAQILSAVRRKRRNVHSNGGEDAIVVTTGELLRDERTDVSFAADERDARTKVTTAVSWLERGRFLQRDENHTNVFQGRPTVKSFDEARERIAKLGLSDRRRGQWETILRTLLGADERAMLDMDELATIAGMDESPREEHESPNLRTGTRATLRLRRTLQEMVRQGLLDEGLSLTAFVRQGMADSSAERLAGLLTVEHAFLTALREAAPDLQPARSGPSAVFADEPSWASLDLRLINADLVAHGIATAPEVLRRLLFALAQDGRRMDDGTGSLDVRHRGGDRYHVRLRRSWESVAAMAERRGNAARAVLQTILSKAEGLGRGEVLAGFGMNDITSAVESVLRDATPDRAEAAADRGLLFLHELNVIALQRGLSVFRQAMGLRLHPEAQGRNYTNDDYHDLAQHYDERVLQVHVMGEYARLRKDDSRRSDELVADYFASPREAFVERWFADRREEIARATSGEAYRAIVEELGNTKQAGIVTASLERDQLVLAGPGSGKTRVVVHRCAYLLQVEHVPPESIVVLCFNRSAAHELRTRLVALAGPIGRRVGVHTYHSLALRLTGRTVDSPQPGSSANTAANVDFDSILAEANAMLRGERPAAGLEPDEMRDRILAGFRFVLVDEYQDVDEAQYDLISAIAGRRGSCGEREERARVLAVGDDDQTIYTWRRADARWLRRFREDYDAAVVPLVENYRSTPNIVAAANALIAPLPGRMKADHPIRAAKARRGEGRGGELARQDRTGRGLVQVFEVADRAGQVATVFSEIDRMLTLPAGVRREDFAILARTHEELAPFRTWCELNGVATRRRIQSDATLPLRRVREVAQALDRIRGMAGDVRPAEIRERLGPFPSATSANPWIALLQRVVTEWTELLGDERAPPAAFVDFLLEALSDQRRGLVVGEGLFLGTAHGAKGLEFEHVFVLDGNWGAVRQSDARAPDDIAAEDRRLYYVAMTRAKASLHLMRRADERNPFVAELAAGPEPWLRVRAGLRGDGVAAEVLLTRHEMLSMRDVDLGYAGRFAEDADVHARLRLLRTGSTLTLAAVEVRGATRVALLDPQGHHVGFLSESARERWAPRLGAVRSATVVAMLRRDKDQSEDAFRDSVRCDAWEVPIVELVL
ncbi:MAG: RecQ family ATP-dependent DNA helicase [Planctomycetes bacterium]|nr:RecQ family ATP-dependent DNA helicase [Planctomycetota bacterium]